MQSILRLVREAHRRSLWQVLSVYLVGAWIALQVVQAVTQTAGLPDWTPSFAFVLMVIGLPIVLATAFVQEGTKGGGSVAAPAAPAAPTSAQGVADSLDPHAIDLSAPEPKALQRTLTWRRAVLGGVGAFGLLVIALAGYFTMRALGVGPVASLQAQGLLGSGSSIVLADFKNATPDTLLGSVVTEAMRIDLASAKGFALVDRPRIDRVLGLMQRQRSEHLTAELAREVAIRDGIDAVLEGDVGSAGSGYILSATLRSAEGGVTLATFRRTARSGDDVIDAIDKLSQDVREKTGESLRSIKQDAPLQQVTTGSLDALRKYTEGMRLLDVGDERGGLALLEEAVAADSTFSMAWRRMATVIANRGLGREREIRALEAAYRHRDRLTELERYLAEAAYHNGITGDDEAIASAYENVLRIDPESPQALNNLGNLVADKGDLERAEQLYRTAISGRGVSPNAYLNLTRTLIKRGKSTSADSIVAAFRQKYPQAPGMLEAAYWAALYRGDLTAAAGALEEVRALPGQLPGMAALVIAGYADLALARGQLAEFERRMDEAARSAGREVGAAAEIGLRTDAVSLRALAGDTTAAKRMMDALSRSGLFAATPVEERPWRNMAVAQLRTGDAAGAKRTLDAWRRDVPDNRLVQFDRADLAFLAVWAGGAGPAELLSALEAYRREAPCVRCFRTEEARWLMAAGRPDDARAVLRDLIAYPEGYLEGWMAGHIQALELLGELAERAGDKAEARDAYRRFADIWKDADGAGQPRLRHARERLAALGS